MKSWALATFGAGTIFGLGLRCYRSSGSGEGPGAAPSAGQCFSSAERLEPARLFGSRGLLKLSLLARSGKNLNLSA